MAHNKRPNIENFDNNPESQKFEFYVSMAEMLRPKRNPRRNNYQLLPLVICRPIGEF